VVEAAKFSTTLVQLAGDLGSFNDLPTADALAAIQSGLQGQAEPLRNFGVFLDDLSLKQALFNATGERVTGTLTTQQKMVAAYSQILADTTVQQGDFTKYQETLGNQLKIVSTEFENLTRDIGMILIPVITEAMPLIREMALELGERLKAAIESVDWKSLTTTIVNLAAFFVTNAENITKFVIAVFALNTAFKLMTVASGLVSVALTLQTWLTAQLSTGMTIASVAAGILNVALRLIPFVAVAGAIALVVNGIIVMGDQATRTGGNVRVLNGEIVAGADLAPAAANKYEKVAGGFKLIEVQADAAASAVDGLSNSLSPDQAGNRQRRHQLREENRRARNLLNSFKMPDFSSIMSGYNTGGGGGPVGITDSLNELIASQQTAANQEQGILDQRLSAFESFNNAVKSLFGQIKDSILSSFNLPTLGNSINSITRNIGKLLEKTKGFAQNISKLAGLGLNPALLQQVIGAGPMAGSQLAAALVGGGSAFVSQLNSAYGEFGNLASGIAGAGVNSAFNNPTVANTYNIEVNGGVGSGPTIGKAIVDAIKSYERTSGAVWQGA
jgi:hypothetical protein